MADSQRAKSAENAGGCYVTAQCLLLMSQSSPRDSDSCYSLGSSGVWARWPQITAVVGLGLTAAVAGIAKKTSKGVFSANPSTRWQSSAGMGALVTGWGLIAAQDGSGKGEALLVGGRHEGKLVLHNRVRGVTGWEPRSAEIPLRSIKSVGRTTYRGLPKTFGTHMEQHYQIGPHHYENVTAVVAGNGSIAQLELHEPVSLLTDQHHHSDSSARLIHEGSTFIWLGPFSGSRLSEFENDLQDRLAEDL